MAVWICCSEDNTSLEHMDLDTTGLYSGCYGMNRLHKYIEASIVTPRRDLFTNYRTGTQVTGMEGLCFKTLLD